MKIIGQRVQNTLIPNFNNAIILRLHNVLTLNSLYKSLVRITLSGALLYFLKYKNQFFNIIYVRNRLGMS